MKRKQVTALLIGTLVTAAAMTRCGKEGGRGCPYSNPRTHTEPDACTYSNSGTCKDNGRKGAGSI